MLRSIATTTVVSIIIQLLGLMSGVLIARMLGAEGRGELTVIMMWPSIIATAGLLGVDIILARKSPHHEHYDVRLYMLAVFFSVVLGVSFVLIGYFMLPYLLSEDKLYLSSFSQLFLLYIPSSMLTIYLCSIALGRGDIKRYNYSRLVFSPVYIILLLIVFISIDVAVQDVVLVFIVSSTITGLLLIGNVLLKSSKVSSEPENKLNILREGLPFGFSATIYSFSTHLPSILLAALVDVKTIGLFAVAYVVSTIHMPFGNAIGKVLFSEAARSFNSSMDVTLYRFRMILLIYVFVAVISLLILPYLLSWLYGVEFNSAIPLLDYIIPATCILAVVNITDDLLKGFGVSHPGIVTRLIGVVVLIVVGFMLTSKIGVQGLLYALLIKTLIEFYIISNGLARHFGVKYLSLFKYKVDDILLLKNALKNML